MGVLALPRQGSPTIPSPRSFGLHKRGWGLIPWLRRVCQAVAMFVGSTVDSADLRREIRRAPQTSCWGPIHAQVA